jgi:uncharacterized membrane protein
MSKTDLFSTRRLEALTDGVFAIAMTLLVLDLKVDALGPVSSSGQLWNALRSMDGSIASFVISFMLLGGMWAVHMRQFEFIKHTDRHLVTINTLRLLAVVFIPLTTSIAGSYAGTVLGRVLFPLNFFILAAISYWQWHYAVSGPRDLSENLPDDEKQRLEIRNRSIVFIALVVTLASIVVGNYAFLLFAVAPLVLRRHSA